MAPLLRWPGGREGQGTPRIAWFGRGLVERLAPGLFKHQEKLGCLAGLSSSFRISDPIQETFRGGAFLLQSRVFLLPAVQCPYERAQPLARGSYVPLLCKKARPPDLLTKERFALLSFVRALGGRFGSVVGTPGGRA